MTQNIDFVCKIGTRPYWRYRLSELLDMESQLGLPTLFVTLSAADLHWPDLIKLMVCHHLDLKAIDDADHLELLCQEKVYYLIVIS